MCVMAWVGGCSSGGDPANAFDDPSTTGTTGGSPAITTVASTIDPGMTAAPADSSSTDGPPDDTASGTTMGASASVTDDTTAGDPDTDSGGASSGSSEGGASSSSSSSSSDDGVTSRGSSSTEDDGASMSASASATTGGCEPSGVGNYADCLAENQTIDTTVCANAAATCIVNDVADPFIGGCAVQNCIDACGCPPAPATGDAPVVCEDLTGDMLPECWLDCSGGDACPDGMFCYIDQVCLWPNMDDGSVPYGDCATMGNGICGLDAICLVDGPPQTIGVCSESCTGVADCSPAPPGGTAPVTCSQLVVGGDSECHLSCGGGQTCPPGMSCFGNLLCAWDV
jgi:hypothetical protein